MADEDYSASSDPNDRNLDGRHDDYDRRPGNSGDSAEYARKYDPNSTKEFSNQLEPQNLIQARKIEADIRRQRQKAREAMNAAQKDVHFFEGIGKFIIPSENTWAAHAQLINDKDTCLFFDPKKYHYFDEIIANKLNLPELTDEKHKDYAKYNGLRTNLAILRNDIIGMYLQDGGFDPGDEVYVPIIASIAEAIGDGLANDVALKRPFTNYISRDVANVEAVGAAEIYKHLLKLQDKPPNLLTKPFEGYVRAFRETFSLPERRWGLLPLEETPFSPEHLSAPPPSFESLLIDKAGDAKKELAQYFSDGQKEQVAAQSIALMATTKQFQEIDSLNIPTKENSVEEARKILRALRNLQFTEMDVEDWLSTGTPPEQVAKAESLSKLVMIYAGSLTTLKQQNRYLLANPDTQDGGDAAGAVAIMMGEYALSLLPKDSAEYQTLESLINQAPAEHEHRTTQSVARLLEHMERGLTEMSGQQLSQENPIESLLEIRSRIERHAKQLGAIEKLEPPVREESLELGREILRKLKDITFRNTSMKDAIDSGRPEEKLIIAQKIEELVDIYRNLLAEASISDPNIMQDIRVQEANDAVSNFSHMVSIMAAKEIPNSMASSMGITSDATLNPKEWDAHLEENTINRLLTRIEGGLKKAVESVETQEMQEQKQDEQQAQDIINDALNQIDGSTRRKRRKRRKQSGTATTRAKRAARELAADDHVEKADRMVDKSQKREERREEKQSAYMGLSEKDIAAIKALGGTLHDLGKQVQTLPSAHIASGDSVAPSDKTAAELAIESIKNRGNRNRTGV